MADKPPQPLVLLAVIAYELLILLLLLSSFASPNSIHHLLEEPLKNIRFSTEALILVFALFLPLLMSRLSQLKLKGKLAGQEVEMAFDIKKELAKVQSTTSALQRTTIALKNDADRAIFALAASIGKRMENKPRREGKTLEQVPIEIGMMDFTESWIIAELLYQQLQAEGVPVSPPKRKDTTVMTFLDIRTGKTDLYGGFSGTGMTLVGLPLTDHDQATALRLLNEIYNPWELTWLSPLGFENREALVMLKSKAKPLEITTMSQLARHAQGLRFGANQEYFLRDWAYPKLERDGLHFQQVSDAVDINSRYQGLLDDSFDVGVAWTTDPELLDPRFQLIQHDDKFSGLAQFAMPLCRSDVVDSIAPALAKLTLTNEQMRELNEQVLQAGSTHQDTIRGIVHSFFVKHRTPS